MGTLIIGCRDKNSTTWHLKGSPMESQRQQYNIGEKPTFTQYTYIDHPVGTPKEKQTNYYLVYSIFGIRVLDYGTTTVM